MKSFSHDAIATALLAAAVALSMGCDDEKPAGGAASASAVATGTAAPTATVTATPTATATASAAPAHDCPAGSSGDGTLAKPCDAKGNARMMELKWNGKPSDAGPAFSVVNKSPTPILYGWVYVYFYDKSGKQLEVKEPSGKPAQFHRCSGNLFGGVMKPAEKATITFSCVKKDIVPENTAQIEAEMQEVGFADASEKKIEYYWRNAALTPEARPKGGVK